MGNPLLVLTFFLLFMGCTSSPANLAVRVASSVTLQSVPSGSALAALPDGVFLLGDDSPFLFHLVPPYSDRTVVRHLIQPEFTHLARIPKPQKPDWESVAEGPYAGQNHLFVFGSGSITPARDSLLIINPSQPTRPQRHSLTQFYDRLLQVGGLVRDSLNLEGAVVAHDVLYLFNRGTNSVFRLPWVDFIQFLAGVKQSGDLQIEQFSFTLPQLEDQEARFSGACYLPDQEVLLFTATVENTSNWVDDGAILGSFVGMIPLNRLSSGEVSQIALLKNAAGETATDKVESIAYQKSLGNGEWQALAVTDNDDGTSKLLELHLTVK